MSDATMPVGQPTDPAERLARWRNLLREAQAHLLGAQASQASTEIQAALALLARAETSVSKRIAAPWARRADGPSDGRFILGLQVRCIVSLWMGPNGQAEDGPAAAAEAARRALAGAWSANVAGATAVVEIAEVRVETSEAGVR
jgi:hypothetical protein